MKTVFVVHFLTFMQRACVTDYSSNMADKIKRPRMDNEDKSCDFLTDEKVRHKFYLYLNKNFVIKLYVLPFC